MIEETSEQPPPQLPEEVWFIPNDLPDQQKINHLTLDRYKRLVSLYNNIITQYSKQVSLKMFRDLLAMSWDIKSIDFDPSYLLDSDIEYVASSINKDRRNIIPKMHEQLIYIYTMYCSDVKKPISVIDFNAHHLSAYLTYKDIIFDPRDLPDDEVEAFLKEIGQEALKLKNVTPGLYIQLRTIYNSMCPEAQESISVKYFRQHLLSTYLQIPKLSFNPSLLTNKEVEDFLLQIRREKRIALLTPALYEKFMSEYIKLPPNVAESFSPVQFRSFLFKKYEEHSITFNAQEIPDNELKSFLHDALLGKKFVITMKVKMSEPPPQLPLLEKVELIQNYLPNEQGISRVTPELYETLRAEYIELLPNKQESFSPEEFQSFLFKKFKRDSITFNVEEISDNKLKSFLQDAPRERDSADHETTD